MDRREFAALLPSLLAAAAILPQAAEAQPAEAQQTTGTMDHPVKGTPTQGPGNGPRPNPLPELVSGVYTPGTEYGGQPGHRSSRYLVGMLKAGNIQIEMHESFQDPGAAHEKSDKHLHNEIWCVREGFCDLTVNGVTRRMGPGDVGIVCAGDYHYIANGGDTRCAYFVITVGPPEPAA